MNKDRMRKELAEDDFHPSFGLWRCEEDGMYMIGLRKEELCISYSPVKCIYAYGVSHNTIRFEVLSE